jgi:peptidoglycan hydrolase-like protein with peptidoglycan-binding domain
MAIRIDSSNPVVQSTLETIETEANAMNPEQEPKVGMANPEELKNIATAQKAEQFLSSNLQMMKLQSQVGVGNGLDPDHYEVGPSYNDVKSGKGELEKGHAGAGVLSLQQKLTRAGFATKPDGYFGHKTEDSLSAFQKSKGLPETGKLDAETAKALDQAAGPDPKPQPQPKPAPQPKPNPGPGPRPNLEIPDIKPTDSPELKMAKIFDVMSNRLEKGYKKGQDPAFDLAVQNAMNVDIPIRTGDDPDFQKLVQSHGRFMAAAQKAGF